MAMSMVSVFAGPIASKLPMILATFPGNKKVLGYVS